MRTTLLAAALLATLLAADAKAEDKPAWWNDGWRYRTTVVRTTPYRSAAARPVEAAIDFPLLLKQAGLKGQFDPASIRLVARTATGAEAEVPFARRSEYDARKGRSQYYLAWWARPELGKLDELDVYFDTKDRKIKPSEYDEDQLPPANLVGNASFERATDGKPDGWAVSPAELVRLGRFAATSDSQSLAIVVDEKTSEDVGREATISQTFAVGPFAGQEMVFECDLLAEQADYGAPISIELEQFRKDGARIPQFAVQSRWLTLELAQGQVVRFSQRGRFDPEAATVNVRIRIRCSVRDADTGQYVAGPESFFTVWLDRVVVRPGERWSWPCGSNAGFVQGALDQAPLNRGFQFTGQRRLAFNGASEGTLTGGRYNPNPQSVHWGLERGTLEFWCRPMWDADDGREHVFFEGIAYGHRVQSRLRKLGSSGDNQLEFAIADSSGKVRSVRGRAALKAGQWRHLAAVWDFPRAHLMLFVDGKPIAEEGPHDKPWPCTLSPRDSRVGRGVGIAEDDSRTLPMQAFIGGDSDCSEDVSAEAVLDEFRISSAARYAGDFAPSRRESSLDEHTRALFHFENETNGVHDSDDRFVQGGLACELHPGQETAVLESRAGGRIDRRSVAVAPHAPQELFEKNRVENRLTVTRPFCDPPDPSFVEYRQREAQRVVETGDDEFTVEVGGDYEPLMNSITYEHAEERASTTTLLPRWRANDNVVPFSFQDLAATLAASAKTDAEKAFEVHKYALATSNYYDANICETLPSRHRDRVAYTLCKALNIYAFDQCGPLNYTLRKLMLAAGISSNDASGTHHQFEQAYYDGDYRLFDLSPRMFWLTRDNATVASRRDFEADLYLKLRQGSGVCSGLPGRVSRARYGSAERPHNFAFPLRAGERVGVTWHNEGRWIEITGNRKPIPLGMIPPYFGNGAVVFEPVADSEAVALDNITLAKTDDGATALRPVDPTKKASLIYQAACPYIFSDARLRGSHRAKEAGAIVATLSFDEGKHWTETWRNAETRGTMACDVRDQVMARYAYWLKLELAAGSDAEVSNMSVRSTFVASPLALPGKLSLGKNRIRFAGGPVTAAVKTTCRWVERHRTDLGVSLNSICYYMNSDQALRNLFVVSPGQQLPVKVHLAGRRFSGEVSIAPAPSGWKATPERETIELDSAAAGRAADFAIQTDGAKEGDVAAFCVVIREDQQVRRVPAQVLLADAPLVREAEAADEVSGQAQLATQAELSGAADVQFAGDGRLAFDMRSSREGVYALWLRARWAPHSDTSMSLQIDDGRDRRFSATAMIGFTDWESRRRAHTKMFAHFGEQYGHWSWYRLPDVQLTRGEHRLTLGAGSGAYFDALLLLPQNPQVDRAAMNLLQNWNYAPWDNPL